MGKFFIINTYYTVQYSVLVVRGIYKNLIEILYMGEVNERFLEGFDKILAA